MVVRHRLAVLLLAALVAGGASAQGVGLRVNRTEATVEDQILLSVKVEGSRSVRPGLPELTDFEIYPRGQSTQMSFVNGRASTSVTYEYVLIPRRPGVFEIGPASVELDGETHTSNSVTVRILEPSETPRATRTLFTSARVSTTRPWVGQQVVYTWRLYRRVRIGDARLEPQEFPGFLVEDLGEVREYQTTVEGVQYLVSEMRKALFPQEEGTLTIPESILRCEVVVEAARQRRSLLDDFLGAATTQSKVLRTREIELEVVPLPPPPPDFSGLVGDFEIAARLSKRELQVGESATLDLTIGGRGNVQMIGPPRLPALEGFKVYDDRPAASIDRSGSDLVGSRTYRKALVPLAAGALEIPSVRLTFFDPGEGSYRSARTEAIPLSVRAAEGREDLRLTEAMAPGSGKVAVRILADDLLPIYEGLEALAPRRPRALREALVLAGLLAPPGLFLTVLLTQRRRRLLEQDASLRRRKEALKRARRELRRLRSAGADGREAGRIASRCLRRYIGDKLGLEGRALTPVEVDRHLRAHGVGEQAVTETRRLLERLEAAELGIAGSGSPIRSEEILRLVRRLDRGLRRPGGDR